MLKPHGCAAFVLALTASLSGTAGASQLSELPSVLVIAKSSNRNQVHYAATVDEACAPAGPSPLRPYWHMLERGPLATEPLAGAEQRVLGLEYQEIGGATIEFALRGMPARAFTVHMQRLADGRCSSWVGTTIAGTRARLSSFYVQQKLFGAVDYVLLSGVAEDGTVVRERVSP